MTQFMKYYQLDTPDYETDHEDNRSNPVSLDFTHFLPSLNCPYCGLWASTNHVPQSAFQGFDTNRLPDDFSEFEIHEWSDYVDDLKQHLNGDQLSPGLSVGPCIAKFSSKPRYDFLHFMPSQILVSSRVNQLLVDFEGYRSDQVVAKRRGMHVEYHLLCPKIVLWQEGVTRADGVQCTLCKRDRPRYIRGAPVTESKKKIHLGMLNNNPCRIVVSEDVVSILRSHDFDNNVIFEPV